MESCSAAWFRAARQAGGVADGIGFPHDRTSKGAYRFRPDGKRFRLRAVVGRLATLKVDRASIAEAQFSLAA
jgi:hypothetical protein